MSAAWVHRCPHVEDLALPKSLRSGNFILAKGVIRWMSVSHNFLENQTVEERDHAVVEEIGCVIGVLR